MREGMISQRQHMTLLAAEHRRTESAFADGKRTGFWWGILSGTLNAVLWAVIIIAAYNAFG